jgi:hypothetical protein
METFISGIKHADTILCLCDIVKKYSFHLSDKLAKANSGSQVGVIIPRKKFDLKYMCVLLKSYALNLN